jgi:hypothetical protein
MRRGRTCLFPDPWRAQTTTGRVPFPPRRSRCESTAASSAGSNVGYACEIANDMDAVERSPGDEKLPRPVSNGKTGGERGRVDGCREQQFDVQDRRTTT